GRNGEKELAPPGLVLEANAPQFRAAKERAKLFGRGVDGVRGNQSSASGPLMPAPPRHEPRHVVARDVGHELVLAEEIDQERQPVLGTVSSSVMLPDLLP